MTTLYHTLFVDRMYGLEHNNMTAAPVIKGNTSGFLPTRASLSTSFVGCCELIAESIYLL